MFDIRVGDRVTGVAGTVSVVRRVFNNGCQNTVAVRHSRGDFRATGNHKVAVWCGMDAPFELKPVGALDPAVDMLTAPMETVCQERSTSAVIQFAPVRIFGIEPYGPEQTIDIEVDTGTVPDSVRPDDKRVAHVYLVGDIIVSNSKFIETVN
jgi:hypothetical protein